ncbi:MAG: YbdK family carboxylate-amine ligase [Chryseolinea sp.]
MKKVEDGIEFASNTKSLTIGVELEFQVLAKSSLDLTPRANDLLTRTSLKELTKEFFQSTIELVTPIYNTIHEVEQYFKSVLPVLHHEGETLGLTFAGTGTHPFADYRDRLITPTARYQSLVSKNRWLIRRMAVYGMHVHFGMKSGEECIKYHNFFLHLVPHMIALSASSPFWHGVNTELAACRPTMYEALPTAGIPYRFESWKEFQSLVGRLIKTDSITSFKDLWWDIRPSPLLGTIEIRVCDGPPSLSEMLTITSFLHAAAHWFEENKNEWSLVESLDQWVIRENKWRAIRNGLDAEIIISNTGETRSIRDDLERWVNKIGFYYTLLNYQGYYNDLGSILALGNSSQRQNKIFQTTNSLKEVAKLNNEEFISGRPSKVF